MKIYILIKYQVYEFLTVLGVGEDVNLKEYREKQLCNMHAFSQVRSLFKRNRNKVLSKD